MRHSWERSCSWMRNRFAASTNEIKGIWVQARQCILLWDKMFNFPFVITPRSWAGLCHECSFTQHWLPGAGSAWSLPTAGCFPQKPPTPSALTLQQPSWKLSDTPWKKGLKEKILGFLHFCVFRMPATTCGQFAMSSAFLLAVGALKYQIMKGRSRNICSKYKHCWTVKLVIFT